VAFVGQKARMPRATFVQPKRRRSPLRLILPILLLLLVGGIIYLSTVDTEVPTQRIEQDVTNEALAK
jgi:hypothetical protein